MARNCLREVGGTSFDDLGAEPKSAALSTYATRNLPASLSAEILVPERLEVRLFAIVIVCHGGYLVNG